MVVLRSWGSVVFFPLGFWGIGLVAHFVGVFVGTDMSDRMAQREYERLKHGREY